MKSPLTENARVLSERFVDDDSGERFVGAMEYNLTYLLTTSGEPRRVIAIFRRGRSSRETTVVYLSLYTTRPLSGDLTDRPSSHSSSCSSRTRSPIVYHHEQIPGNDT